jgi:biopolymer transport protein ExbD
MGISAGGSKAGPVSDPNIVPLIDVLLVLIIIFMVITFMVITPRVPTGLPTLIPQSFPPQTISERTGPNAIVVQVLEGGKLMINQDQSDWNTLGARLSDIFKQRADKVAFVKGDNEVPFAQVARAIDIMRGAGIDHVGLMAGLPIIAKKGASGDV